MKRSVPVRLIVGVCAVGLLGSGCVSLRELVGYATQNDPSVTIRATEPKWLLIKNPRFGDVASEPEYIWVEEDKVPSTLKTSRLRQEEPHRAAVVVAKYGSPPGGGRISPQQGGAYQVENVLPPTVSPPSEPRGGGAVLDEDGRRRRPGPVAPRLCRLRGHHARSSST